MNRLTLRKSNAVDFMKRIIRIFSPRDRITILLSLFLRISLVALDLAGMVLTGGVASLLAGTKISKESIFGKFLTYIEQNGFENGFQVILTLALVFFISKGILSILIIKATSQYLAKLETKIAKKVFTTISTMKLSEVERLKREELIFASTHSVTAATSKAILTGSTIISEVALLIIVAIFLAATNLAMFTTILVFYCVVGALMHFLITRYSAQLSLKMHSETLESQNLILSTVDNFRQLSTSPNRFTLLNKFGKSREEFAKLSAKYQSTSTLPRYITEISIILGAAILMAQRYLQPENPAGAAVIAIFLAGIFRIVASLLPIQSSIAGWKNIEFEARYALDLLDVSSGKDSTEQEPCGKQKKGRGLKVEFSNVTFGHRGKNIDLFENFSLKIDSGEYVGVIGQSGTGKSTFADLILGFREPRNGKILIDGVAPWNFIASASGLISYVPQNISLFNASLRSNVSLNFGVEIEGESRRVQESLKLAGLYEFYKALETGLESIIGEAGQKLSGEKRNVWGLHARSFRGQN